MSQETDEEIALRVQKGNVHLFGVLLERYLVKMKRYANKFLFGYEDAEDLVQDVFVKAYVNIQSFDPSRKFSPWLYRIAHNEFINAIKKRKREPVPFFDPDTIFPHPVAPEDSSDDAQRRELKEKLDLCLKELSPNYREPLVLYYYEDLNYEEIADIMHLPVSTIGVRLKRGREALQKIYIKLHPHG